MSKMAKLEVRNLTISFRTNNGAVRAVRDISFDLNEGETLAIAGESGSGKSVTTRAVMGILAGNAMVEGGEIIYDGKDLLKIPEEDFHTLRGHKLSMVFQDPLSALNPIMKIGKQLTEAMILNNKERRRDGKERFNSMLKTLEKNIVEAKGATAQVKAETEAKTKEFNAFVEVGVKLDYAYKTAREAAVEILDSLDEMETELGRKAYGEVRRLGRQIKKASKTVFNAYTIPEGDAQFTGLLSNLENLCGKIGPDSEQALHGVMGEMRAVLQALPEKTEPNFFTIGYMVYKGMDVNPATTAVEELNRVSRE